MSVIGSGLLGYCPKCNEPVVENFESIESLEKLSRCKSGHIYPSVNTQVSPSVVTDENKDDVAVNPRYESVNLFHGLSDQQSIDFQVEQWVRGRPLHNAIRDECCPDFSCCGSQIWDKDVREKFKHARDSGDVMGVQHYMLMSISKLAADAGANVHIAGENPTQN